jgi:hypothetical protein
MREEETEVEGADVIAEMNSGCVLMRARLISRVLTAMYDEALRPFGIGSPQFALLVIIFGIQPATLVKGAPTWRAAQARAKALLGEDGVTAITDIANGIMNLPA